MRWLSTVAHAGDGKLVIEKMRLDQTGFPQPTGEFEELAADCLVLALGQDADLAVLDGVPGVTFSGGLDESTALFEARRCMSCGICAAECPCGAIAMVPEEP